ncbi:MAG: c-di-GMP-binding flagellar brake protein YcgR [Pseudohongiellaceae bacterium]|jgi:c-di-GMP-binding flagellar brake protein YcgR
MTKLFHKFTQLFKGHSVNEATLSHYIRLKQLCLNHQTIQIKLKNNYQLYQSLILSVDEDIHELLIDDLFPAPQPRDLRAGDTIELISQTNGQEIKFFTRVIQHCKAKGKTSYRVKLPKELGQNHNRQSFRVYVDTARDLRIRLSSNDAEFNKVTISNLSINGIKLYFDNNIQDRLNQGVCFDQAVIQLPSGYNIDCKIDIKNYYLIRTGHSHSVAGGGISISNPQHKKKLQEYLATIQRQHRRRENRDL